MYQIAPYPAAHLCINQLIPDGKIIGSIGNGERCFCSSKTLYGVVIMAVQEHEGWIDRLFQIGESVVSEEINNIAARHERIN